MKKMIAMLLALLMMLSLAACGEDKDAELKLPQGITDNGSGEGQPSAEQSAKPQKATVAETVLYDDNGLKITAKSLDMDGFMGPELKLAIENNAGKDLIVQSRGISVNGYMVDTIMSVDVANGKKANDSLTFMEDSLEMSGIDTIEVMEFSFVAVDADTWEDHMTTDLITLTTEQAQGAVSSPEHTGQTVYDENDVKIVVKGLDETDDILGPGVVVYIENNRKQNITVQTQDVSVNGFMVDPIFSCDVLEGKRAVDTITFLSSDLEENGITNIEEMEISFNIFDMDEWDDIADSDAITVKF